MEILQILTEADFKVINEGLDILCKEKSTERVEVARRAILDRVKDDFDISNERDLKKIQQQIENFTNDKKIEFESAVENIRLLQAKLIQLKRQLAEQAQVNAANELLK